MTHRSDDGGSPENQVKTVGLLGAEAAQPHPGWCRVCGKVVRALRLHMHTKHGRQLGEWLRDVKVKEEQLQRLVRE